MNNHITVSSMRDVANFEDPNALKDFLAVQLNRGSLALVLGAGASVAFGLPNWNELIERSFHIAGITKPDGLSNTHAADALLAGVGSDELRFAEIVRSALYERADLSLSSLRKNALLAAVGALTMASSRGSVSRVISFNFDDLLERFLAFHGFDAASIDTMPAWAHKRDVSVLHPHGLLTSNRDHVVARPIVLAQIHYDNIVGRFNDLWRSALVEVCRSNTCIFIGLSGTDSNLTSVMADAKKTHAGHATKDAFWGVRFGANDAERTIWHMRGVYQHTVADYAEIPEFLFDVCQRAARRRGSAI